MSLTEIGAYMLLLSHCWLDNGIPTDVNQLARIVKVNEKQFARMWQGPLSECFYLRSGRLQNVRLDAERTKQADYKRRQTDAADKRWDRVRNAVASSRHIPDASHRDALQSPISDLRSPSAEKNIKTSGEASSPPFCEFPTIGSISTWICTEAQVLEWEGLFTNIDVKAQLRTAMAWINANADKRKTAKGMPRFLVSWLTRAVDSPRGGSVLRRPAWTQADDPGRAERLRKWAEIEAKGKS